MKTIYILILSSSLLIFSCKREYNPSIIISNEPSFSYFPDTIYYSTLPYDSIPISYLIKLNISNGSIEINKINVSFGDSTCASYDSFGNISKFNCNNIIYSNKSIIPNNISPFDESFEENLTFPLIKDYKKTKKYYWSIYVVDANGKLSNTINKSVVLKPIL
jgi:hypothetical protein